jgi:glycosyltransferase involved in cell wall biosynthesis
LSGTPKIYINGKFLCQKATGVQKFALGISLAIQKKHPEIIVIMPKGNYNSYGLNVKKSGWVQGFFWEQIYLPLFLLFHSGYLLVNLCNTAPLFFKRQIVTIHDLAFLKNIDWFSKTFRIWYKFLIPRLCKSSHLIITVSEFIKNEIIDEYKIPQKKIIIVPNGIPEIEFDEQRPFPFRYLLLTGIYNPRKNASFVISQLSEIKKNNFHIVGVGADTSIYGNTEFPPDKNLHLLNYVDDNQYYTLMKHADALVFPSVYEGFGIPILEALIIESQVIAPDISVYRESFSDLPIYYKKNDANSFLDSLNQINVKKPSINELSHLKNKYNFGKSAEILLDMIK